MRYIVLATKLLLSVALVWFAASSFDLNSSFERLRNLSVPWLLAILGLYFGQLCIAAIRFHEIVKLFDERMSIGRAVDVTLIGYFFSQTLISFVGGDAMRVLRTKRSGIPLSTATKAIVVDRGAGFAGQITLILLVLPFLLPRLVDANMVAGLAGLVCAAIGGVAAVWLIARLPAFEKRFKALDLMREFARRVLRRLGTTRGVAIFIGLSVAINLMNCVIFFTIARGVGVEFGFIDCLIFLPPVFFMSMLPISVAGWGVREGAAIVALGILGVAAADSLAISIAFGLGLALISLPGGLLWLVSHRDAGEPIDRSKFDAIDDLERGKKSII